MSLTDIAIKALQPRSVRYLVGDGNGLYLEVLPSGKLSWIYRYRLSGKPEKMVIGSYPVVNLKTAREIRNEKALLVTKGISPALEKKKKRISGNSFKEFTDRWIKDVCSKHRKDVSGVQRYLDVEINPILGKIPIEEITVDQVQSLLFKKRDSGQGCSAKEIRNLIKRIFDYAIVCRMVTFNPAAATPNKLLYVQKSRDRVLRPTEIKKYLKALYECNSHLKFKLALHLILLTMVRKSELITAKPEHFHLESGEWIIPKTKNGREHIVYLSRQAIKIVEELLSTCSNSKWILPNGSDPRKHINKASLNCVIYQLDMNVEHFTVHDLRRTGSTILNEKEFNSDVIEVALNHKIKGVRGIYNRAQYSSQRKQMLQFWADYIDEIAFDIPRTASPSLDLPI